MTAAPDAIAARFQGNAGAFGLDAEFSAPLRGVTALFGASGSGKTTILRCIAGLHRLPGRLAVGSDLWQDDAAGIFRRAHERPIGYVFQEASLFQHLSVRDNLRYGHRRALHAGTTESISLADAIAFLGLEPLLDRSPATLSGGERQRVAIGRAVLSQPRLLLMDEPLASLDAQRKAEILPYLERLRDELALPILYVSHSLGEVARLADTLVVIANGHVVASGPVGETLARLDLGDAMDHDDATSIIVGRVVSQDVAAGVTRVAHPAGELSLATMGAPIGTMVRLRVRARDVALATGDPGPISIRNRLQCAISEIAPRRGGAVDVRLAAGNDALVARVTRDAAMALKLTVGQKVIALIKATAFDRTDALD